MGCTCCGATGAGRLLKFTTGTPQLGSKTCSTTDGVVTGTTKNSAGTVICNLRAGGLYTGGSGETVPLPSVVPDMGSSFTKTSACSGTSFTLAPTNGTETGVTNRTCTAAGVTNPEYKACVGGTQGIVSCGSGDKCPCLANADCTGGTCTGSMSGCLFGPPLPIPNSTFTGASVCVINRVAASASGSGSCSDGSTTLDIPLSSDLYLTGDLLDGSAPDRPAVTGIQPCPLCLPAANPAVAGCTAANCCAGGPKHLQSCTPGDSASLGDAYPTSHDCPPPPGPGGATYIGALPIPFGLTTSTTGTDPRQTKTATLMNGQQVFCGFCGSGFSPDFHNPPVTCTANTDCTGLTGCPTAADACDTCKQRDSGAFAGGGAAKTITEIGKPAGVCIADGAAGASTLVSVFCIPPSFNLTVDANGDLPGPGAVALPGMGQLLP